MKKIILPSAIVLIVAAVALSMGVFNGEGQFLVTNDGAKECGRTAVMASGKECGDKSTAIAARSKECGDKSKTTMASAEKECGAVSTTTTRVAEKIECPHSGAVLRASDEVRSCGDRTTAVHASANKVDKEDACCEKHALASAD